MMTNRFLAGHYAIMLCNFNIEKKDLIPSCFTVLVSIENIHGI